MAEAHKFVARGHKMGSAVISIVQSSSLCYFFDRRSVAILFLILLSDSGLTPM